jgi:hypothetical protein
MYRTKKISFISCLTLVLIGFSSTLKAISGAELAYECLGANQYRITLQVYRDCSEALLPNSQTIDLSSISCGNTFAATLNLEQSYEVSGIHSTQIANSTCNGGTLPGFEIFVYTDTVFFSQTCEDWLLSWTGCCRNPNITNLSTVGSPIYIEAGIDSRYLYSSPQFNRVQLPYHCANSNTVRELLGPTGYPSNMDTFVTVLTCPLQGANNCLNYATGLSVNKPFHLAPGSSIGIDNIRRNIFFDAENNRAQMAAVATTIYQIKNGDTVGYVQSELPVVIDTFNNCNGGILITRGPLFTMAGIFNPYGDYNRVLCAGETSLFDFIAYDPDGDSIELNTIEVNLAEVFGASNYVIFVNNNTPFRLDSVQIIVQITPVATGIYSPLKSNFKQHFRVGLVDNNAIYPSYTYLDMNLTFLEVIHGNIPKICPYASTSVQVEIFSEGRDSLSIPPFSAWEQVSGPPVSFSDTSIHNPIITTTPSVHGDSIVLQVRVSTVPDSVTGTVCVQISKIVLDYDSSGYCTRPFPNLVEGAVRVDTNLNCVADSLEARFPFYSIILFEKGIDSFYYAATGQNNYEAYLDTGTYAVSIEEGSLSPYWNFCQSNQTITIDTTINPQQLDWSMEPLLLCPKMEVNLSGSPLRPFRGRRIVIDYQNTGTKDAINTYVELTIDSFVTILSSSVPVASQVGAVYRFDLDTVSFGTSGQILLYMEINASVGNNTPYTIDAHIYPDSLCLSSMPNLVIVDSCDLDTAYFQVINYADAHSTPLLYWIIEDQTVVDTGFLQLGQGQSLSISYPMDVNQTYQLVIDPSSNDYAASYVVNCTGDSIYTASLYQPNNQLDYISTIYKGTVNSFDPNIKVAEPEGYSANHYIFPNTPIDYTIHFQNTGTDTAYQIVILDTLSAHLDVGSLEMKGASHAYTWRLMPYNALGYSILEFTFDPILLVDSLSNEPASHGFVHYKIQQKPNLPNFTRIENSASIYFDLNAPIKTNTAFHTICDTCHLLMITDNSVVTRVDKVTSKNWTVKIYPNPVSGTQLTIEQYKAQVGTLELYTLSGVLLKRKKISQNIEQLDLGNLVAGAYFLRITNADSNQVFKVIKQ